MIYYIINKIEDNNGELKHTPIGYTTNINDRNIINSNYDSTLGIWIENNKVDLENGILTTTDYFNNNPICYSAKTETTDSGDLIEITDINNL